MDVDILLLFDVMNTSLHPLRCRQMGSGAFRLIFQGHLVTSMSMKDREVGHSTVALRRQISSRLVRPDLSFPKATQKRKLMRITRTKANLLIKTRKRMPSGKSREASLGKALGDR